MLQQSLRAVAPAKGSRHKRKPWAKPPSGNGFKPAGDGETACALTDGQAPDRSLLEDDEWRGGEVAARGDDGGFQPVL